MGSDSIAVIVLMLMATDQEKEVASKLAKIVNKIMEK